MHAGVCRFGMGGIAHIAQMIYSVTLSVLQQLDGSLDGFRFAVAVGHYSDQISPLHSKLRPSFHQRPNQRNGRFFQFRNFMRWAVNPLNKSMGAINKYLKNQ
jgi:hypothetical protein